MKDKICVVTGANSGIGKVTALALAEQGATVAMVCRNREKGEQACREIKEKTKNNNVELFITDLSSQKEIRKLAADLRSKYKKIDVLVNNAGGINPQRTVTVDGIETTFAVNHLAYFLLTSLVMDRLKAAPSARIVNVSSEASRGGRINLKDPGLEKTFTPVVAYSQSKLANILFTYKLAHQLSGTNVTVNALHPGVVRTNFGRGVNGLFGIGIKVFRPFLRTPEKGAETMIWLAISPEAAGISGKYFYDKKPIRSQKLSYDTDIARQLWDLSSELTGIKSSK